MHMQNRSGVHFPSDVFINKGSEWHFHFNALKTGQYYLLGITLAKYYHFAVIHIHDLLKHSQIHAVTRLRICIKSHFLVKGYRFAHIYQNQLSVIGHLTTNSVSTPPPPNNALCFWCKFVVQQLNDRKHICLQAFTKFKSVPQL